MKLLPVLLFLLLAPLLAICQAITINGRVQTEEGSPVAGATVVLKHTGSSTRTTADGRFSFSGTGLSDTLVVTAVGYQDAELPFNIPGQVTVTLMRTASALAEVVVNTGYQSIPKERATGSFTRVGSDVLNRQLGPSVLSRLEGVTSGILFDKNSNRPPITVRGLSTINGPKAPLVILNNFPYEGNLANINPNDVESITVLKDAAAASIWGTRAGNGVIVITTKSGKIGQPLQVEFNANTTVSAKPGMDYLQPITPPGFIEVEKLLFEKGYYNSQLTNRNRPALTPVVEILQQQREGRLTAAEAGAQIEALGHHNVQSDFLRHFYQPAVSQQYALSLRGGTANSTYSLSGGYDHNTSNLDATYKRATLRFDHTVRPVKNMVLDAALGYTRSRSESGRPGYGSINVNGKNLYPYARLADDQGAALPVAWYRAPYTDTAGGGHLLNWNFYPLTDHLHNTTTTAIREVLASLGLRYRVVKGLELGLRFQYQEQQEETVNHQDVESFAARDLVNRFTQVNRVSGAVSHKVPEGGVLNRTYSTIGALNGRAQAAYAITRGWHTLDALAGAEIRQVRTPSESYRLYGYKEGTAMVSNTVNYADPYPNFITGALQFIPAANQLSERLNRFASWFGNAAWTYRQRYTVSGSVRRDAANLFGVQANQKGVPLWSAGAAWNLSKEPFYKLAALPSLRLRATWGFSGNADNSRSAVTTLLMLPNTAPYTNLPFANVSQFPNPALRWEKVRTINLGIDFETAGNFISGTLEGYHKQGTDLFGLAPLDYTTGMGTDYLVRNVAEMKGSGVDLTLNISVGGQLRWQQTVLFSYNNTKISSYYLPTNQGSQYISNGTSVSPLEGRPVYAILSYRWAGLDGAGNPMGYLDGAQSADYNKLTGPATTVSQLVFGGPALPPFFGSWGNALSWRNWSFSANIAWKMGHVFRRPSINYSTLFSLYSGHADYAKRWQHPGDEMHTTVPALVYPANSNRDNFYNGSEVLVTNAGHIRLQFINLAYSLARDKVARLPLQQLQLYANAANLGILWRKNKFGLDPDYPGSLPPARSWSLGLRVSF